MVCGGMWRYVVVCGGMWYGMWWYVVVFGGMWWYVVVCGKKCHPFAGTVVIRTNRISIESENQL